MKLVRYGSPGKEKPGLIDSAGQLRSLSAVLSDIAPEHLSDSALARLRRLPTDQLPRVRGTPRIGCPVSGIGKFIAIGLNYSDHAAEAGMALPKEPIIFMKATSCIQGPNDPVMLPKGSVKGDWEVELGIVIGTRARYVSQKEALNFVAGYCLSNDVSEREFQLERGPQWDKGKGCDTFGPLGPWLVTRDEVPDPHNLAIRTWLNGQLMQDSNTANLVFGVPALVEFLSQTITLEPGDIIATGTPPGVGCFRKPPVFLKPGDVVRMEIAGLGTLENPVVAEKRERK